MSRLTLLLNSIFIISLLFSSSMFLGSEIKGYVYDKNSTEQLIGATGTLNHCFEKPITTLDGNFTFQARITVPFIKTQLTIIQ